MSLSEKLKKKKVPTKTLTVEGDSYVVAGMSLNDRGRLVAAAKDAKGKIDNALLDKLILAEAVSDAEDGSKASPDEWGAVPTTIAGPLLKEVLAMTGDSSPPDPKPSGSTES